MPTIIEQANKLQGCLRHLRTTAGRRKNPIPQDGENLVMESDFRSDEAKIGSSKAYRLLPKKTQVLTGPKNPFIRTRASHVEEVIDDSVVLADVLGLNADLARAIAKGHDIGHVPGGHPAEYHLARRMGKKEFCHEVLGPLIMQKVERRGYGINLTFETLEGMLCHSGSRAHDRMTQEAWVVRYADKIAYLTADYNDMVKDRRMGFPVPASIHAIMRDLGPDHRTRTSTLMAGLIVESSEVGRVSFEHSKEGEVFKTLRSEMNELYPKVTRQDLGELIDPILEFFERLGIGNPYLLFALMTDEDMMFLAGQKTLNVEHLQHTALCERLEYLPDIGNLDLTNPYLNW